MRIWPKMRNKNSKVRSFFKAPKPVTMGKVKMKGAEKARVNVINKAAVGMGSMGMKVGKKIYKFK